MVADAMNNLQAGLLRIGIIGLGPRGLAVLERLLAMAELVDVQLSIAIFEPGEPGVGVHTIDQPDYLVLNTIACQLTAFPDHASLGGDPERTGPSLYEWCKANGVKVPCSRDGSKVCDVQPTDFLPRRLLGFYLQWAYSYFIEQAPSNVTVEQFRENAILMERSPITHRYRIVGETGTEVEVDKVFITIGPTRTADQTCAPSAAAEPIFLAKRAFHAADRGNVEIPGLGLTAMDSIASFTLGRSGSFTRKEDGTLIYKPSGQEPAIIVFSRSGLPFRARPKGIAAHRKHQPVIFTEARVTALRKGERNGQLDFEQHILPMLKAEMKLAYYGAHIDSTANNRGMREKFQSIKRSDGTSSNSQLNEALAELSENFGPFDPEKYLLTTLPENLYGDEYRRWIASYLTEDLAESKAGLAASATKRALEVWRDLRDQIRMAVNLDGLTESSRAQFYSNFAPLINRLVAGPHIERQEEFLALLESGVVRLIRLSELPHVREETLPRDITDRSDRNEVTQRSYASSARVGNHDLRNVSLSFTAQLIHSGILSQIDATASGGIRVDEQGHAIDVRGTTLADVWVFGPLVEGATYYNHYVSSPGGYSRAIYDANRAARECLTGVEARAAA